MNLPEFKNTIAHSQPPDNLSAYLLALWYDAKGNWNAAHETVQDIEDKNAYWIHAYLHRKEGDQANAGYWYNRAKRPFPSVNLSAEWQELAGHFLHESQ